MSDVLRKHWPAIELHPKINSWQLRTLSAIKSCRTAALGGHSDVCTNCGHIRISYNSCRNRHCPKCQGRKREEWIMKRQEELLPVPYFHVVFTLPDLLNVYALNNPSSVYDSLFEAAWETIDTFAADHRHLGAKTGMICILHTWGQTLSLHPHLHCIIPGGGLNRQNKWKTAKSKGKYLFPVKALSVVFRAKYIESIKGRISEIDKTLINALYKKSWVVYAKRPFGSPSAAIEYLGRYTHRIAISNNRITGINDHTVSFRYKDYRRNNGTHREMELDAIEFIRRFSMHILPKGFVKIRHFGILSSTTKRTSIPEIRLQLIVSTEDRTPDPRLMKLYKPAVCPYCKTETMILLEIFSRRGPPRKIANHSIS